MTDKKREYCINCKKVEICYDNLPLPSSEVQACEDSGGFSRWNVVARCDNGIDFDRLEFEHKYDC